jgi:hypothetical protein
VDGKAGLTLSIRAKVLPEYWETVPRIHKTLTRLIYFKIKADLPAYRLESCVRQLNFCMNEADHGLFYPVQLHLKICGG